MNARTWWFLVLMLAAGTSGWAQIDEDKLVDLTYSFDEHTLFWPGNDPFHWERTFWGQTVGGYWYSAGSFTMAEHGGTHIDAPIHFGERRRTLEAIPLRQLIGPAVVVDVAAAAAEDVDYRVTVNDLQQWESRYGRIPFGAVVLAHTGWGSRWPDRVRYFGSETPDDAATFHFPGFSREAAEFLVRERRINGVGIDTPSIDHGPSRDFIVHRVLNEAELYGLENVANIGRLPPSGAIVIALPMKIAGGTGGPVRIIAVLPDAQGRSLR